MAPFALLSATQSGSDPSGLGTFTMLGAIVAAVRRKHAIGGWLLFLMWQVFAGCGIAIYRMVQDWRSYTPAGWHESKPYLLFVLSFAPHLVALLAVAAACIMLLRTFDWGWASVLRTTLIAYLACGVVSVGVDWKSFPSDLKVSVASLIFPMVFLAYTHRSERFSRVFRAHDWRGQANL